MHKLLLSNLLNAVIEVYRKCNCCIALKVMTWGLLREGFTREVTFGLGSEG